MCVCEFLVKTMLIDDLGHTQLWQSLVASEYIGVIRKKINYLEAYDIVEHPWITVFVPFSFKIYIYVYAYCVSHYQWYFKKKQYVVYYVSLLSIDHMWSVHRTYSCELITDVSWVSFHTALYVESYFTKSRHMAYKSITRGHHIYNQTHHRVSS